MIWLLTFLLMAVGGLDPNRSAGWTPTANSMSDGRWAPSAVILPDGRHALLVGGYSYTTHRCVASADLFNETTHRFQPSHGRLTYPRDFASANLLPDGTILIAGGYNSVWGTLSTAELYHPSTDTFTVLPSRMHNPRELFQTTLLHDDRILFTGGFDTGAGHTLSSTDIYDPSTNLFTSGPSMTIDRFGHAAVGLTDGRVLVVGGKQWTVGLPDHPLASAEIYDPVTNRFTPTAGSMAVPRDRPTTTLLSDGTVLVAGGQNGNDGPIFAESFDPATGMFRKITTPMLTARMAHSAVALSDRSVLLAGGWSPPAKRTTDSTELYEPGAAQFVANAPLPHDGHDLALLLFPDGLVLAAGGKQVSQGQTDSLSAGAWWQSR